MSLISYYNKQCPLEIHVHRKSSTKEYTFNRLYNLKSCFLCDADVRSNTTLNYFCENYINIIRLNLCSEVKHILSQIFSGSHIPEDNDNPYYLPKELQDLIFSMCNYNIKEKIIKKIDENTITHMNNCEKCSPILLNLVTLNTCSHHIISRNYIS